MIFQLFFMVVTFLVTTSVNADCSANLDDMLEKAINEHRHESYLNSIKHDKGLDLLAARYLIKCSENGHIEHGLSNDEWYVNILSLGCIEYAYIHELLQQGKNKNITANILIWNFIMSPEHNKSLLDKRIDYFGYDLSRTSRGYYFVLYLGDGLYE